MTMGAAMADAAQRKTAPTANARMVFSFNIPSTLQRLNLFEFAYARTSFAARFYK
jgi:hypothetical protein